MGQLFACRPDEAGGGLYRPQFEHDNCGIGAVVSIQGIQTHKTVENALSMVEKLDHRAGKDAEGKTGDGVGILLQISHSFFTKAAAEAGISLPGEREYGVGMFFFPQNELRRNQAKRMFEVIAAKEGVEFLGWRAVAVCPEVLGSRARDCMPAIYQGFLKKPKDVAKGIDFDRKLYIIRRVFELSNDNTYVCSLSSRTIVYKGMFLVRQLRTFFPDLRDEDYRSAIAVVHSRFSTNTNPSWERAHPNRFIVHNGEINTIRGNADKMLAREETLRSPYLPDMKDKVFPIVNADGSDSAMLDNALEFMTMCGMDLPLAVMICIPEPFMNNKSISREKRDFYQYYATLMEPWDGPASILFSDGDLLGAVLDRNGLRPSRYYITDDDYLILSSEVGVMDVAPEHVVLKERLHPGKMLLVDTRQKRVISDEELKNHYATAKPYGEWLDSNLMRLSDVKIPNIRPIEYTHKQLVQLQKAFGYTYEEYRSGILTMAMNGAEGTAAMGVDTPLAALSSRHQPLFHYFKQLFAQVTNPPIDSIREEIVTSTTVYLGKDGNLLEESEENCRKLRVSNPILTNTDMLRIKSLNKPGFISAVIPITYYKSSPLSRAMDHLFVAVDKACAEGASFLVLSDRGVDENHMPIPSLLAVSGVNQYLVQTKKRLSVAIILESGEPREVHHFATLLGYGASAVNPYLALDTIGEMVDSHMVNKDYYAAVEDYCSAILTGIVKIASKMGISTIQSYQGAKIFEAIGISKEVIDKYFAGTVSPVGGITLDDIAADVDARHTEAFDPLGLDTSETLVSLGDHKSRAQGEPHRYNPQTIYLLQRSTRLGDYAMFKKYTALVNREETGLLRTLMDIRYADEPIPLDEVESVESIVQRFKTGAMSYGSISKEAHETMAIAMNTLHGYSNTGEGGEEVSRLSDPLRCSAIKQVASGRFGVTSEYLVHSREIQIKMAQGAKPGEGGHLPAKKVFPWIAKTRYSTPGVALISPPPHHDIYSIEDLAQLIYDLKNANKYARISVKLVSEAGVGTVAAGVAKAGAQVILISGYDGGTGAAPASSIHNAGLPWELGLAETHQTLIRNGLRSRVRLETDGKLMSGRDVAIACLLGAEEFGFATAPLITMGCVMMRVCNLDTCPMGVATQNPELRKRFIGKPEYVINFMRFIAQELREYMAKLGFRTVDEMVGHADRLTMRADLHGKAGKMDLHEILYPGYANAPKNRFDSRDVYDFGLEKTKDEAVLLRVLTPYMRSRQPHRMQVEVSNVDRTFGTILGAEITRQFGTSLADDTYVIDCAGAGGQSFGAFIPKGLTLTLTGDSNDYFGKGLSGGKLVVKPPKNAPFKAEENILIGNVALYGATGGSAFVAGVAGERFAVRNSGARAVVEGVGDHGCEYMTGGRVVVLGKTGVNFAAGMSGGIAYVLDVDSKLYRNLNKSLVEIEKVERKPEIAELRELISQHVAATDSERGKYVLAHFEELLPKFKKIIPTDYKRMLSRVAQLEEKGYSPMDAQVEAFYDSFRG
ncbi:MAG: glutamate synthase large subunit [Firmicutes bacterium]|nr:glutamate synthase large subunit [Bacillota bacterium]